MRSVETSLADSKLSLRNLKDDTFYVLEVGLTQKTYLHGTQRARREEIRLQRVEMPNFLLYFQTLEEKHS